MDEKIRIEGVHKLSKGADDIPGQTGTSQGFPHRRISYVRPYEVGFEAFPENVKNRQKDIFVFYLLPYLSSVLSVSRTTVSTCVEAMKCKYAPNLEAIEVDISPTASSLDEKPVQISLSAC